MHKKETQIISILEFDFIHPLFTEEMKNALNLHRFAVSVFRIVPPWLIPVSFAITIKLIT